MPSLIPKKLRRYKKEYPYSYPLLFFFLETAESLVKLGFVVLVCIVGYFGLKSMLLDLGLDEQSTSREDSAITSARAEITSSAVVPAIQESNTSTSPDQSIISPEPEPEPEPEPTLTGLDTNNPIARIYAGNILRNQAAIAWITNLDGSDFIIQFAATPDEKAILEFTRDSINGDAVVYPFKRTPSGRPVYGVASTYVYESLESAQSAVAKLPKLLKERKPWIRPAAQVQRAVANNL